MHFTKSVSAGVVVACAAILGGVVEQAEAQPAASSDAFEVVLDDRWVMQPAVENGQIVGYLAEDMLSADALTC